MQPESALALVEPERRLSEPAARALAIARRHFEDSGLDPALGLLDTSSRAAKAIRNRELGYLAVRMRRAGIDYRTISRTLKVTDSKARYLVAKALDALSTDTVAEARQLQTLELGRLDAWEEALQERIAKGNAEAINTALAIQARRLALQGAGIGRSGVMQAPLGSNLGQSEGAEPSGVGTLSYVELRAGIVGSPQEAESLRALVSAALQAGAVRMAQGQGQGTPKVAGQASTPAAHGKAPSEPDSLPLPIPSSPASDPAAGSTEPV